MYVCMYVCSTCTNKIIIIDLADDKFCSGIVWSVENLRVIVESMHDHSNTLELRLTEPQII